MNKFSISALMLIAFSPVTGISQQIPDLPQQSAAPVIHADVAQQYSAQDLHREDYIADEDQWVDEATLARLMKEGGITPPKNEIFTRYQVKDIGVTAVVPVKMAIVGTDTLSLAFLQKYQAKIKAENINVILIGDKNILRQFRQAYPGVAVQNYPLDGRLYIMLNGLGVRYYPAFYEEGAVYQ